MDKSKTINFSIKRCINNIERNLSWDLGSERTRRDYEILAEKIFESTGVLLSISTLRRIWNNEYKKIPHRSTLDALAIMAGYSDWQNFIEENNSSNESYNQKVDNWKLPALIGILIITAGLIFIFYFNSTNDKIKIYGPIKFNYVQKVDTGVPNIIVHNYDVSKIVADSFFIVESADDYSKKQINKSVGQMTSSYFKPGIYETFLVADDSIIQKLHIEILTNTWVGTINYNNRKKEVPFYFYGKSIIQNGKLSVTKDLIKKSDIRIEDDLSLCLSKTFKSNLSSKDNFIFETKVKLDSIEINASCPELYIVLIFENDFCYLPLVKFGGQDRVQVKYGNTYLSSSDSDLSGFGCDIYNWQNVKLLSKKSQKVIFLNDAIVTTLVDTTNLGEFRGFSLTFDGIGSIDYVSLKSIEGDTIFYDDFEQNRQSLN